MKCPYCGAVDSNVLDSRPTEAGSVIRRRRECPSCQKRFTTYERHEEQPLLVVKKDGRRETFERRKILNGMIKACEKRPIPLPVLEQAAADIERDLRSSFRSEIPAEEIGERVMQKLRDIDEVAYVRFASVYRQFKDVGTFLDELERLLESRKPEADRG
ncbi:MAG: transcriptional repressor NrdR [Firmicutes bacterium]|nr:transcriptional repressor NrdR [Bacillota bacterium]